MFDLPSGDTPLSKLFLLNMAACGGELGFSSVTTIAPTLLRRQNFSETAMSITMGIGPFLALLAIPLLGQWTDRCSSRLGRRKPFLLVYGLLLLLGITCIPAAAELSAATAGLVSTEVILTLSVVLSTFTAQVFFNPYQALISDLCPSEQDARRGFSVFALMVNVGSVLSNLLFSWSWFSGSLLVSQRATFGLIAVLVSALTAVTLLTTRELAARSTVGPDADAAVSPLLEDVGYGSDSSRHSSPTTKWRHQTAWHLLSLRDGLSTACWTDRTGLAAASDRMARLLLLTPLTALCRVILWPYSIFRRIHRSPMVLRRLFIVDLLSWMALLSFYMFLTDYLGQAAGGRAEDPDGSEGRAKFDEGVRMGSKCLMIDGVSGGLFSLFGLMPMTRRLGTRNTYVLCLTVFSSCMVVISLAPSPPLIYVLCAVMGCGYSVMGTTPSSLLTLYHYQPQIFFSDQPAPREAAGLGENFAILDTSYCLGSILPSLTLGWLVDMYGMPHLYVMIGGLFGFLSAGIATTLIYRAEEMVPRTKSPVPATR